MSKIYIPIGTIIFSASILYGDISGVVFKDIPVNGSKSNIYGKKDSNELGVKGVSVTATSADGQDIISTTTDSNGHYTLNTKADLKYRVEFSNWPSYLKESYGAKSVQFVSDGQQANLALQDPNEYSNTASPEVAVAHLIMGDINTTNPQNALVVFDYNASQTLKKGTTTVIDKNDTKLTIEADKKHIGSVWGLAYNRTTKKLYASAFLRRHSALGQGGLGAIYVTDVDNKGSAKLFATIPDAGSIDEAARGLGDPNQPSLDKEAFAKVGKVGLGDIDISSDDKTLYVTNLHNKKLYALSSDSGDILGAYDIPNPSCKNGDFRPFATKFYQDKVYVGGVCDGSKGTDHDISAHIFSFDTKTNSFDNNEVLSFPLDYHHSGSVMELNRTFMIGENNETTIEHSNIFHKWSDEYNATIYNTIIFSKWRDIVHPVPMLTDLEFTEDGSMVIGLSDRTGLQFSSKNITPSSDGLVIINGKPRDIVDGVFAGGDILKANFDVNSSTWTIEKHVTVKDNSVKEFFSADRFFNYDANGNDISIHHETSNGSVAYLTGSKQLFLTAMDPVRVNSGGVIVSNTQDGNRSSRGIEIFHEEHIMKASGMGDIELLTTPAPIEIGDRVWEDKNKNGIQDADEKGISNVKVNLVCNGEIKATAITDDNGYFIFSNDTTKDSNTSHIYGIKDLVPGVNGCSLVIPGSQNALKDKKITQTGNGNSSDDNNGINNDKNETTTSVDNIPSNGANNHSFDFGFYNNKKVVISASTICLGNYVWYDKNLNGIQDEGAENGVRDVTVELLDSNGNLLKTTKTDDKGYYKFCDLTPGRDYKIKINTPKTYTITTPNRGNDDTKDSDAKDNIIEVHNPQKDNMSFDAGIYCDCDKNGKTVSGSAFNFASILIFILSILMLKRRD